MPVMGKGNCMYGFEEECLLGDKGINYEPLCCLVCAVNNLAKAMQGVAAEIRNHE